MMRASILIVGMILLFAPPALADPAANLNELLRGDYVFTGEGGCLVSLTGFNANLTPNDGRFVTSFTVQGVTTFNGDGTGTFRGRSVGITHSDVGNPLFGATGDGGAGSDNFEGSFTYIVAPDRTFTRRLSGPVTGTVLTGTRAGQTFTIDQIPAKGFIAKGRKSLTLATDEPTVEVERFSNGDIHRRICHRSRTLFLLHEDED